MHLLFSLGEIQGHAVEYAAYIVHLGHESVYEELGADAGNGVDLAANSAASFISAKS